MSFEVADRLEFIGSEAQEVPKLSDRANGILRLPSPAVPLGVWNIAPERMAPGFTGRLFFLDPTQILGNRAWLEPGALFAFVHRWGCLQKTKISSTGPQLQNQVGRACRRVRYTP